MRAVSGAKDALYGAMAQAARRETGSRLVLDGTALLEAALQAAADPGSGLVIHGVIWNEAGASAPHVASLSALVAERGGDVAVAGSALLGALRVSPAVPACVFLADKPLARQQTPEEMLRDGVRRLLLLVSVLDPMNVGVILRTAEAFGYEAIAVEDTADPRSRRAIRSSTGSALRMTLRQSHLPASAFVRGWRLGGGQAVATSAHGPVSLGEMSWRLPHLVAVGNETHGLDPDVRQAAEADVRIPMVGKAHSLNVTVATGIVIAAGLAATHASG